MSLTHFGQVLLVVYVAMPLLQPIFGLPDSAVFQKDFQDDNLLPKLNKSNGFLSKNFSIVEVGEIREDTGNIQDNFHDDNNFNKSSTVKRQNLEIQLPVSLNSVLKNIKLLYIDFFALYLPDIVTVNPECRRDLAALYDGITDIEDFAKRGIYWPLKMVDSWGKGSDGILNGNLRFLGSFHECLNITVKPDKPPEANFRGKYCFIEYHRQTENTSQFEEMSRQSLRSPFISVSIPEGISPLAYATCMPSTCTEEELRNALSTTLGQVGYVPDSVSCQTRSEKHDLSEGERFGIFFFSCFGIVLLIASCIDILADLYPNRDLRGGYVRYFLVFSVPHNLRILFHLETEKNPKIITSLHGLRFFSICWIVLGHQYELTASLASNLAEIPGLANKPAFQIIANGTLSVDTFFFMSGLLVCLITLRKLSTEGQFNVVYYYVHRIVRLLPSIICVVIFITTVSGLLVSGPISWYYQDFYLKGCRSRWWLDLTFISNLINPYLEIPPGEWASCMPHLWFVDVDVQLYWITPFLVVPLHFWKKLGPMLLGLWTAASVIIPASIIGAYHLPPASMITEDPANLDYFQKVYIEPWCRAGPYIIGIWTGYILHTAKNFPYIPRMRKFQTVCGWVVAITMATAVIFGITRYNKIALPVNLPEMSMAVRVLYGSLHRAGWGLALLWIVLACHWGHGGPINWFLSHPIWQPMSRLTYCIYLTSVPIQLAISVSSVTTSYFSNLAKLQETCGNMFIIVLVSIPLVLIAETPVLRLEKLLMQPHLAVSHSEERSESSPHLPERSDATQNLLGRSESSQNLLGRSESSQNLLGRSESSQQLHVKVEDDRPECEGIRSRNINS